MLESHLWHRYYTLKTEVSAPRLSYLLCCNKKQISSFILYMNSNWQLPDCRFIPSDLTVRRQILSTYLSQENKAQQEVLLSQKEWVVVVAQQCSYCKVMFMTAPAAKTPSSQSLSNNVSWGSHCSRCWDAWRWSYIKKLPLPPVCPAAVPLVTLPSKSSSEDLTEPDTPPHVSQPYGKGVWTIHPPAPSVHHPGPSRCPQTWSFQRHWKGWIVVGEFFFQLSGVWFWLNTRIKENGGSFSKLHVCIFVITWGFTVECTVNDVHVLLVWQSLLYGCLFLFKVIKVQISR